MSSPSEIKKKLDLVIPKEGVQTITPFIHGVPGIGKSAVVKQIAEERGIMFIDLRLSQHEASDIKGIPFPDPEESVCRWLPPEFIPFETTHKYNDTKGILFLDELNRAAPDVLQTIFQLVLDRQVGNLKLRDDWHIVCAGNLGDEDECDVQDFDPALNNRFIHFRMDPDLKSWTRWASKNGIHDDIVAFINAKPAYLYRKGKDKMDNTQLVTPRSWEKFSDIIRAHEETIDIKKITNMLATEIIGDASVHFMKYLEEKTLVEPKDILNNYEKVIHKLKAMSREQVYATNQELVHYIASLKNVLDKHLKNVHRYCTEILEDDIHVALLKEITTKTDGGNSFIDKYLEKFNDEAQKVIKIMTETDTGSES